MPSDFIKRLQYLVIITSGLIISVYSQTPSFYNVSVEDGLPSNNIHAITQDSNGFIWFGTTRGVARFDGRKFQRFGMEDGLNSNMITALAVDEKGTVYVGNYEKGINIISNGVIEKIDMNGEKFYIQQLLFAKNILFANGSGEMFSFKNGKKKVIIDHAFRRKFGPESNMMYEPVYRHDGTIIVVTHFGVIQLGKNSVFKVNIKGISDNIFYCASEDNDGFLYLGGKGKIYIVKNYSLVDEIKLNQLDQVWKILMDSYGNLWFTIHNKGIYYKLKGTNKIINIGKTTQLENSQINRLFEDKEGNVWACTFDKGAFCFNSLYLSTFDEHDGLSNKIINSISKAGTGKLIIGTYNGLNIYNAGIINSINSNYQNDVTEFIYESKIIGNQVYVCASGVLLKLNRFSNNDLEVIQVGGSSVCVSNSKEIYIGRWDNCLLHFFSKDSINENKKKKIIVFGEKSISNRINEIFEDGNGSLWIGTNLGLCKITKGSKQFFANDEVLSNQVNCILNDKHGNILFGGEKGVVIYNVTHDTFISKMEINEYQISSVTALAFDSKDRLWIGCLNGLYCTDDNNTIHLNVSTGLPSEEIHALYFEPTENILYIGSNEGLTLLDVDEFDNYTFSPPKVVFNSITAGDSIYTNHNKLILEPEQNNVSINFSALCFSAPKSVKYKYRLNKNWYTTGHDYLEFRYLQSGKYNMQIMAKSQNSVWSKPLYLNFEISPYYYETMWFKLAVVSVFVTSLILIVIFRIKIHERKTKEQIKQKERINELKHMALSAMMNPHFIFNALNSVQSLVNNGKAKDANEYIAMMAKLIRRNLDTAGMGFIYLADEIDRLKLYLSIELLRFNGAFSYDIILDEQIEVDEIMIPNMIIQPFVENSLWHGIKKSGRQGLLTISFSYVEIENNYDLSKALMIKISDNGIGIIHAKHNKKEDHVSKGIKIIEERLQLLSDELNIPQPIMIEDLNNRNENSIGTEVLISLPPPLYKIVKHLA